MEGGKRKLRCWDKLSPDVLGLIFVKLPQFEILTVIPSVCKSWGEVVSGPYCWHEINITELSKRHCFKSEDVHRMLQMLITRSCGSLRKLSVSHHFNDSMLSFVAEHASCLQTLELIGRTVSNSMVEQVAHKLSTITSLDLSFCSNIGALAIEAIGKHCKSLVRLRLIMSPWKVHSRNRRLQDDEEAHAIATTMKKLRHLEISSPNLTTVGAVDILSSCQELEFLDLSDCQKVKLDEKFLKEMCLSGLKLLVPNKTIHFDLSDYLKTTPGTRCMI